MGKHMAVVYTAILFKFDIRVQKMRPILIHIDIIGILVY